MKQLKRNMELLAKAEYGKTLEQLSVKELHRVLSKAIMASVANNIELSYKKGAERRAYYFSAEFLVGRAIYNNLMCVGAFDEAEKILEDIQKDISIFEEVEDAALGNGGLGRLAACFLDSAANLKLSLSGYGIRYKYGLFKQQKHGSHDRCRQGLCKKP